MPGSVAIPARLNGFLLFLCDRFNSRGDDTLINHHLACEAIVISVGTSVFFRFDKRGWKRGILPGLEFPGQVEGQ